MPQLCGLSTTSLRLIFYWKWVQFMHNSYNSYNYIHFLLIILQIFLKFHLSYEDSHSHTLSDIKSTALHYLKDPAGFPLDLVAILPYEIIGLFVPTPLHSDSCNPLPSTTPCYTCHTLSLVLLNRGEETQPEVNWLIKEPIIMIWNQLTNLKISSKWIEMAFPGVYI